MAKLFAIVGKPVSGEWGNDDETGEGVPVLRTTNFTNEGIINYSKVVTRIIPKKNLTHKFLQKGDIIIEKSGGSDKQPVGRVVFFNEENNKYLFNNFTGLLRVRDQSHWYPRYVFYALFSNYLRGGTLQYQNKTTGLHNLKTDQYVQNTEIREIPICEQKEIADVLDRVNNIIYKRHQQLDKVDQLVKSQFIEMFGDADLVTVSPYTVGDVADVQVGIVIKPTRFYSNNDTGTKAFRSLNVGPMTIRDEEWVRFTDEAMAENKRTIAHTGDVLVVRSGYPGTSCVVTPEYDGSNVIDLIIAHPKKDVIMPEFLCAFTNYPHGKNQIDNLQRGVAQKHFNVGMYKALKVLVPSMEDQKKFVAIMQQADKSKFAIQQSLDQLETLKKSLMQEYFG